MTEPIYAVFLLTRGGDQPPECDAYFGFVVIATSVEEARELCAKQSGDEGPDTWRDPRQSTIVCIGAATAFHQRPHVVLGDFIAG